MRNDYDKTANNVNTGMDAPCSPSDITGELPNIRELIAKYTRENGQHSEKPAQDGKSADESDSQQRKTG